MVRDMPQADRRDLLDLLRDNESVNGLKGLSPLLGLPKVNICNMFVIDLMHLLKGVCERLCDILFKSDKYVTADVAKVSRRLQSIKPPHTMTRFPELLEFRSDFKAKHHIALLDIGLIPCVHDIFFLFFISALLPESSALSGGSCT